MLLNMNGESKGAPTVLVGQPELNQIIERKKMVSCAARVAQFHLSGMPCDAVGTTSPTGSDCRGQPRNLLRRRM